MNRMPVIRSCGLFSSMTNQQQRFHDADRTPVRVVERYEIELYFEDGGEMELNGRNYPRLRGTLLLARPGDRRSSTLPFRCYYLSFWDVPQEIAHMLDEMAGVTLLDAPEPCEEVFRRIGAWFLSDDPYQKLAVVGEFFLLLQTIHQIRRGMETEDDVVRKAQRYIEAHYREEIGVEEIAQACHVSVSYLHRLFAGRLGQSPHAVLTRRRITAAKAMLIQEQVPIADVAWKCGFHSPSYFSDCFRKWVGVSPRAFRDGTAYQI